MTRKQSAAHKPAEPQRLCLDLGCGSNKREGFTGVDMFKTPSVDVVHDLMKFPWPWKSGSVAEIHCSHFFEHIPARKRPLFMDECYRIMKPGAQMTMIFPYWSSARAVQDFTHEWPPVCEWSFLYFNKGWRESNKLTHGAYDIKADFDFGFGHMLDPDIAVRNDEYRANAVKHWLNAVTDAQITLTRRA